MRTGFEIGVGGLVVNQSGEILMVRHTYGEFNGQWLLPGGHPEVDETLEDAVKREVWEETGITASVLGLAAVRQRLIAPDHQEIYLVFHMEPLAGHPVSDGRENDRACYWPLQSVLANHQASRLSKTIIRRVLIDNAPQLRLNTVYPLSGPTYRLFF